MKRVEEATHTSSIPTVWLDEQERSNCATMPSGLHLNCRTVPLRPRARHSVLVPRSTDSRASKLDRDHNGAAWRPVRAIHRPKRSIIHACSGTKQERTESWNGSGAMRSQRFACALMSALLAVPTTDAFSLTDRRLTGMNEIEADPSCATSCDELYNEQCDAADETGAYTLGCDLHPTASCDDFSGCASPPTPPQRPLWTAGGTYPSHPPPPSPPNRAVVGFGLGLFIVALVLVACCCVGAMYQSRGPGSKMGNCMWLYCGCCLWCWQGCVDDRASERENDSESERKGLAEEVSRSAYGDGSGIAPNLSGLRVQ